MILKQFKKIIKMSKNHLLSSKMNNSNNKILIKGNLSLKK